MTHEPPNRTTKLKLVYGGCSERVVNFRDHSAVHVEVPVFLTYKDNHLDQVLFDVRPDKAPVRVDAADLMRALARALATAGSSREPIRVTLREAPHGGYLFGMMIEDRSPLLPDFTCACVNTVHVSFEKAMHLLNLLDERLSTGAP